LSESTSAASGPECAGEGISCESAGRYRFIRNGRDKQSSDLAGKERGGVESLRSEMNSTKERERRQRDTKDGGDQEKGNWFCGSALPRVGK